MVMTLLFALTAVMLADVSSGHKIAIMFNSQIRIGFIFALKCLMLDGTSCQHSGIVIVMVILLLFAYPGVMKFILGVRAGISDEGSIRMFELVPPIGIGF